MSKQTAKQKAHPKSYIPLRFIAATIYDGRRRNGKRGELLSCGHFLKDTYAIWEEAKARRCEACTKDKQKQLKLEIKTQAKLAKQQNQSNQVAIQVSPQVPTQKTFAISFLYRTSESFKKILEVYPHRPLKIKAQTSYQALEKVRKALGWKELPEGTEIWELPNKAILNESTLSPRTTKALAYLEANRILLWKPYAKKTGAIYRYSIQEGQTKGRALMRLSQAECYALYKQHYLSHYKMLLQGTAETDYWGRTTTIIGNVTKAWLLTLQGREALKEHDLTSKTKRTYHDFDAGFYGWQAYSLDDDIDEYDEDFLNEYDSEGLEDDREDDRDED